MTHFEIAPVPIHDRQNDSGTQLRAAKWKIEREGICYRAKRHLAKKGSIAGKSAGSLPLVHWLILKVAFQAVVLSMRNLAATSQARIRAPSLILTLRTA